MFSTSKDVQHLRRGGGGGGGFSTSEGYYDSCGGYHEYTKGCSVHRKDTMNTSGEHHDSCGREN